MIGSHYFLEEPFRRANITLGAQHEINRLAFFIQRAVQILPLLTDLDVGLVNTVGGAAQL